MEDQPPSAALARCNVCKAMMVLLLQLNAELHDRFPGHDRRLYVFACRKQTCRRKQGSIRAVRATRVSEEAVAAAAKAAKEAKEAEEEKKKRQEEVEAAKQKKDQGPGLGDSLFGTKSMGGSGGNPFSAGGNPFSSGGANNAGANSNPFGSSSSNPFSSPSSSSTPGPEKQPEPPKTVETNPEDAAQSLPKTFAETLNLNNTQKTSGPPPPPEPWPTNDLPRPYPVSYLSEAEYETLDPEPLEVPQNVQMDLDDSSAPAAGNEKEVFESSMDAVFQKFADRLAQNPDQSIRYEFGGQPLLSSKKDGVGKVLSAAAASGRSGMPGCANCGAGRVFEVQLTPQAITELEEEELGLEGMDWGTVIVGVCEADCSARGTGSGEVGYLEEWCGVQWEELESQK